MNRINTLFQKKTSDIFSVYFCAGHPNLDSTLPTLRALQEGGVDLVEIGVPFSDPMADGPTIQQAATTALKNGMTLRLLFQQLQDVRPTIHLPLILMGYLNVFYHYGFEHFCQDCQRLGIDGAIIPDLTFDIYLKDYKPIADRYDVKIIMLITPETSDERIRAIDAHTDSFIYQVSTNATTGAQQEYDADTLRYFERIQAMKLKNPTLVGFGISNPSTLTAARHHAAGTIVGSRFVQLAASSATPAEALEKLKRDLGL